VKEMKKIDEEEVLLLELKRNQKPVVTIDQTIFSNISVSVSTSSAFQHVSKLSCQGNRISETNSMVGNSQVREHISGME
jgi:hypothetical protein